jgi:threonine aldolase
MKGFGSDNHASVHPTIFQGLVAANLNHAPSYGTDEWTMAAEKKISNLFQTQTKSFFVFNGTAANVLSLMSFCDSYNSVLVSDCSHLENDECGAPEIIGRVKLKVLPSVDGKLKLETLKAALVRRGDQHYSQIKGISLTQPTEVGTCYTIQEIKEISTWAHQNNLYLHIDGARLANAVIGLQTSYYEMLTATGVDVVSFGGTKNGFMFGEAVVILNPFLGQNLKYQRKQLCQLPSKSRYIAAQFNMYLDQNLWEVIARQSCKMANLLNKRLQSYNEVKIHYPCEANSVFASFPNSWIKSLKESKFFYVWDEHTKVCRLMMSWDISENDINEFCSCIESLRA